MKLDKTPQSHLKMLFAILLVLAIILLWLFIPALQAEYMPKPIPNSNFSEQDPTRTPLREASSDIWVWGGAIRKSLEDGSLQPDDFEKLDFSQPGDASFGSNPDYEIFNPNGRFKLKPLALTIVGDLTNFPQTHIVFNIRRNVDAKENIEDDLVAIIPNMKRGECTFYTVGRFIDEKAGIAGFNIQVAPDNHQVILDAKPLSNDCWYVSGQLDFFKMLARRYKDKGSDKWRYP